MSTVHVPPFAARGVLSPQCQGDFFGNGDMLANENDISITCGTCPEAEVVPSSTASKLLVGVVTAVGAGVVGAASTFGIW